MVRSLCKLLLAVFIVFGAAELDFKPVQHSNFAKRDVLCLAKNIYYEARGEPLEGQLAVAHVTLNRLASPAFPNTICAVVTQRKQFSWVNKTRLSAGVDERYILLAIEILSGKYKDPSQGALFFHADWVKPFQRVRTRQIGGHIFYR